MKSRTIKIRHLLVHCTQFCKNWIKESDWNQQMLLGLRRIKLKHLNPAIAIMGGRENADLKGRDCSLARFLQLTTKSKHFFMNSSTKALEINGTWLMPAVIGGRQSNREVH